MTAQASTPDGDPLRADLRKLGDRRRILREQERKLAEDTKAVVHRARGRLPMQEVARLAGLHRTSLYQTYVDE